MQHQVNHRQIDDALGGARQSFVIFAQAAVAIEPAEGSLDDPALGRNVKALLGLIALDDVHLPAGKLLDPLDKLPGIAGISPDFLQPSTGQANFLNHLLSSVAILLIGPMNHQADDQSERVDERVALAPFDLLACVITAQRPPFSVVLTDWLSRIAALGWGSRSSAWRTCAWSAS